MNIVNKEKITKFITDQWGRMACPQPPRVRPTHRSARLLLLPTQRMDESTPCLVTVFHKLCTCSVFSQNCSWVTVLSQNCSWVNGLFTKLFLSNGVFTKLSLPAFNGRFPTLFLIDHFNCSINLIFIFGLFKMLFYVKFLFVDEFIAKSIH